MANRGGRSSCQISECPGCAGQFAVPGVTITDEQATLDGRKGIAIDRLEEGLSKTRQEIIIEPTTGLLIGEREVLTQPLGTIPAGTAITWTGIKTSVSDMAP